MLARSTQYIQGLQIYHKKLEGVLQQNYNVDTRYLEVLSWGYHTTAFYIKSSDGKEYLLKLADWSKEKEAAIDKDIELSGLFRPLIPTPIYIKNVADCYTCRLEDKILRLSHYISGLAPLDINFDVLGQMVDVLKKIHVCRELPQQFEERAVKSGTRDENAAAAPRGVLLHGDLTPHNVLVSYNKIVAVMDFEMSFVGPKEHDLARTAVFSWNYLGDTPFENLARFVLEKYADHNVNTDLFYKLAVENAQKHLDAVEKHRNDYDRQEDWIQDRDFALGQLTRLQAGKWLILLKTQS